MAALLYVIVHARKPKNPPAASAPAAPDGQALAGERLGAHDLITASMQSSGSTSAEVIVSRTMWARGLKRATDLVLGLLGVILLSPILLTAMLLVKLTSRGPVFFSQVRTGRNGRPFRPFKLRTMRSERTVDPNELVPLDHPEITVAGRLLRRAKLDELPQILNVVWGDMAFVGPRPTLPEQTREYDKFQRRRLLVRPGVTGLAQVNGNTAISWEERIKYDVYYVQRHGFGMDVKILLKTVLVLLRGEEPLARPFEQSPYARQRP